MRHPLLSCVLVVPVFLAPRLSAQNPASSDQAQVVAAPMQRAEPPSATASFDDLVARGDELLGEKLYLDAVDYYRAAIAKKPNDASVHNRMGMAEMQLQRWKGSEKEFQLAIKADHGFADAYNNLGVDYYELKNYGKAIKMYETAIALRGNSASYYSNLGAAYFYRKDFEKAAPLTPAPCKSIPTFSSTIPGPALPPACLHPRTGRTTITSWPSCTPKPGPTIVLWYTCVALWKRAIRESATCTKIVSSPSCERILVLPSSWPIGRLPFRIEFRLCP